MATCITEGSRILFPTHYRPALAEITPDMKKPFRFVIYLSLLFLITSNISCDSENHIAENKISMDSLLTLPNGFYAYRNGRIYLLDTQHKEFRTWLNLDSLGNVKNIFRVEDLRNRGTIGQTILDKHRIDTIEQKIAAQKFIELSKSFKIGHLDIDKANKISFSYKDGLSEQYVMALNDSIKDVYSNREDFKLLRNDWFEYDGN